MLPMRRIALALLFTFAATGVRAEPTPAAVHLRFGGLEGGGRVIVALFADEPRWRSTHGALRSADPAVVSGVAEVLFEGLPPGRYAVMAYQDRNMNGRLDTLLGLPREPYGFSNDARGLFGPPGWADAVFTAASGQQTVQAVRLR